MNNNLSPWLFAASLISTAAIATEQRPNVLLILTDDQRWDAVGYHDKPLLGIDTPNIDRLASEGVQFNNMFVTSSLCSPSRASFLSGTYAHTHGVRDNFTDYPRELESFPMAMQKSGYQTAYIGKWHMGEADDSRRPGYDYWVTHKGQGKYFDTTFNVDGARQTVPGYYAHVVTDMANDWIKNRDTDKPFAMVLGHKAPHGPFIPEEKYQKTYDHVPVAYPDSAFKLEGKPEWIKERLPTWHGIYGPLYGFRENFPDMSQAAIADFQKFVRSYTATINSVDDSVGLVLKQLEDEGILDNTIVIYSSDNSFLLGEHGMIDKRTMHEASIRVPMVVRYPKAFKAGTRVDHQVLSIDLAPTLMELTGAGELANAQGLSWVAVAQDKDAAWRESWLYEYNYEEQFPYTPNVRGVRKGDWKYVAYPHGDGGALRHKEELYNLAIDPEEQFNLVDISKHTQKLAEMRDELQRVLKNSNGLPDKMPIDKGIKSELPEASIR